MNLLLEIDDWRFMGGLLAYDTHKVGGVLVMTRYGTTSLLLSI